MGAKMEPKCIPKWVPSPLRESKCRLSAKPIIYYVLATFWWCPKPSKTAFCLPNSRSGCSAHLLATKESSKSVWGAILKPFYGFLFSPLSPKGSPGMPQNCQKITKSRFCGLNAPMGCPRHAQQGSKTPFYCRNGAQKPSKTSFLKGQPISKPATSKNQLSQGDP